MSSSISQSNELYVPVHRRNRSTASGYTSSTRSPSSLSSRSLSPSSLPDVSVQVRTVGVYTPAELLSLAQSPLARQLVGDMDVRLRAVAPEVVQTRKQRKALAWHAHQATPTTTRGRASHRLTSDSEEDRTRTWRRA